MRRFVPSERVHTTSMLPDGSTSSLRLRGALAGIGDVDRGAPVAVRRAGRVLDAEVVRPSGSRRSARCPSRPRHLRLEAVLAGIGDVDRRQESRRCLSGRREREDRYDYSDKEMPTYCTHRRHRPLPISTPAPTARDRNTDPWSGSLILRWPRRMSEAHRPASRPHVKTQHLSARRAGGPRRSGADRRRDLGPHLGRRRLDSGRRPTAPERPHHARLPAPPGGTGRVERRPATRRRVRGSVRSSRGAGACGARTSR